VPTIARACCCLVLLAGLAGHEFAPGDLVFQSWPMGPLVEAIEGATDSPFSHCGIVCEDADGELVVLEAIMTVSKTPLDRFLARGREGRFAVCRLADSWAGRIDEVIAAAETHLGKPYDLRYRLDDEAIYCSELLHKAFAAVFPDDELGAPIPLGEMDWQPHEALIRRVEGSLPLERRIVSPAAVAASDKVRMVYSNYPDDATEDGTGTVPAPAVDSAAP